MPDAYAWDFFWLGWPWWLVLPALLAVVALAVVLLRRHYRDLPAAEGRILVAMRSLVLALVVLALADPVLEWTRSTLDPPRLAVVIDRSRSMAATDPQAPAAERLDEAEALGLLPPRRKPLAVAAAAVAEIAAACPALAGTDTESPAFGAAWAETLASHRAALAPADPLIPRLDRTIALIRRWHAQPHDRTLRAEMAAWEGEGRELAEALRQAQAAADHALVAAGGGSAQVLTELAQRPRHHRALALARRLAERLHGQAHLSLLPLDRMDTPFTAAELDSGPGPLQPTTDFAAALRRLARGSAGGDGGSGCDGVLLLTDARLTSGGDPAPAARTLAAAGIRTGVAVIGSATPGPDVAVAAPEGLHETYRGERARVRVRWRGMQVDKRSFRLVLLVDGKVQEERPVTWRPELAADGWQQETFDFPTIRAGVLNVSVAIREDAPAALRAARLQGLTLETWPARGGNLVDEAKRLVREKPERRERVDKAEAAQAQGARARIQRLSGFLLPPLGGTYRLRLRADHLARVWLQPLGSGRAIAAAAASPDASTTWERAALSEGVMLGAGEPAAIVIEHLDPSGLGAVALGWERPDGLVEAPIPGIHLLPDPAAVAAVRALPAAAGAQISHENDTAATAVVVQEDPLRALVLDHQPRWEARYLTALLERDPRVTVERRFQAVRRPRGQRELLPPTDSGLATHDLLVLGDLTPAELPVAEQERLLAFVRDRGALAIILAGPRAMPGAYLPLEPLAKLLPVTLVPGVRPDQGGPMAVALTPAGEGDLITRVLDDQVLNRRLWPLLPPLDRVMTGLAAKPGAQVLVAGAAEGAPVVVTGRYGAGKVAYIGSDAIWRWRDRVGERVHQVFWQQLLRWGLEGRLRGRDSGLLVALDRNRLAPDGVATLRILARDLQGNPATVAPTATRQCGDGPATALVPTAISDIPGGWSVPLTGLAPGSWRMRVEHRRTGAPPLVEDRELLVLDSPSDETADLRADPGQARRLGEAGGGGSGGPDEALALAQRILAEIKPRRQEERRILHLATGFPALAVLSLLLAAEWIWRKRRGLP